MHRSAYPSPDALQLIDAVPQATQSAGRIMALVERIRDLPLWDLRLIVAALVAVDAIAVRDALQELEFSELVAQAEAEQLAEQRYVDMAGARLHFAGVYQRLRDDPQSRDAVLELAEEGRAARRVLAAEFDLTAAQLQALLKSLRVDAEGRPPHSMGIRPVPRRPPTRATA